MELNIGKELAALKRLTVRELQQRYAELFDERHRQRRIARG